MEGLGEKGISRARRKTRMRRGWAGNEGGWGGGGRLSRVGVGSGECRGGAGRGKIK